jgi:hypothetical protein
MRSLVDAQKMLGNEFYTGKSLDIWKRKSFTLNNYSRRTAFVKYLNGNVNELAVELTRNQMKCLNGNK